MKCEHGDKLAAAIERKPSAAFRDTRAGDPAPSAGRGSRFYGSARGATENHSFTPFGVRSSYLDVARDRGTTVTEDRKRRARAEPRISPHGFGQLAVGDSA